MYQTKCPYHVTTYNATLANEAIRQRSCNLPNFADAIEEKYGAPV